MEERTAGAHQVPMPLSMAVVDHKDLRAMDSASFLMAKPHERIFAFGKGVRQGFPGKHSFQIWPS